jgi:hypothetical protein
MIYTALKKYERALYFFEVVVTTPSVAVSHIMLEAFKKYILVSLILHEKGATTSEVHVANCLPNTSRQVLSDSHFHFIGRL